MHNNANPRQDYENSPYSKDKYTPENGYFYTHPYVHFIAIDFIEKANSFSNIIYFMNKTYEIFSMLERKRDLDTGILYNIFDTAKETCSKLGVRSPDSSTLFDIITKGPIDDESIDDFLNHEMHWNIDDTNTIKEDILITSIPYFIFASEFTFEEPNKFLLPIESQYRQAEVWYKESYIQKQTKGLI